MTLEYLTINHRAYKFIRSQAIKNVYDGLVELVTNAVDAYRKREKFKSLRKWPIIVDAVWKRNKLVEVFVTDHALGLDAKSMKRCFMQVGAFTSDVKTSRGFFSRGAKDVCALGTVWYETIHEGQYSKVILTHEGKGELRFAGVPASQQQRQALEIPRNGLRARIQLNRSFQTITPEHFYQTLKHNYLLRDVFSDSNFDVCLRHKLESKKGWVQRPLQYTKPTAELVLESEYEVPGYPGAIATFKLFKSKEALEREFHMPGFLVRDTNTIFCHTYLNSYEIQSDSMVEYLYGTLSCEHIKTLMYQADRDQFDEKNPFLIVDHSRGSGLMEKHPFVTSLYDYPRKRVLQYLDELDTEHASTTLQIGDLENLLKEYDILGSSTARTWVRKDSSRLFRAVESTRGQVVRVEREFKIPSASSGNNPTGKKEFIYKREDKEGHGDLKRLEIQENGEMVPATEPNAPVIPDDSEFRIVFKHFQKDSPRLQWKLKRNSLELHINLTNEIMGKYFNENSTALGKITRSKSVLLLGEILTDVFTKVLCDREVSKNQSFFTSLKNVEYKKAYDGLYSKKQREIEPKVHRILQSYIDSIKQSKRLAIEEQFQAIFENLKEQNIPSDNLKILKNTIFKSKQWNSLTKQ